MKKQLIEFSDPIYECSYKVYLGYPVKEFVEEVNKYEIKTKLSEEFMHNAEGVCVESSTGAIAIWVRDANFRRPHALGVLVHECTHAVLTRLVDTCGVDLGEQEPLAFYLGFLIRTIMSNINGKKGDKKC